MANDAQFILIGTYKAKQLAWIKRHGVYNYPVKDEDRLREESCAKIKELWLYAGAKAKRHCFAAEFLGLQTRSEFLAANPTYAKLGEMHHEKYLVFKVAFLVYGPRFENPKVFARVSDFAARTKKIAAAIEAFNAGGEFGSLADALPADLAKLPQEQLCVCEEAVQMDFMSELDDAKSWTAKLMSVAKEKNAVRFIDLFAGIGGIRKGFEQACEARGIASLCVFTSEIKPHALQVLKQNHPDEYIHGDITAVDAKDIPDFDVLLGGFPCQAFSAAGKRLGFEDTRGTLFFDVARIIKEKRPQGFVLENVEGLVNHDKTDAKAPMGKTLTTILETLAGLGYEVSWRVLNAKDFGIPQDRKRIYIVGSRKQKPSLENFGCRHATVGKIVERGLPTQSSPFIEKLLAHYSIEELEGKSIKDKRGGDNNIHSWDIELKGSVSARQKKLLNALLKERRKHQWAEQYGIDWMDGMPLTVDMIRRFFDDPNLQEMLDDLAEKRYVVKEHPKRKIKRGKIFVREQDPTLPMGYNIVAGKMSYEISKILSPKEIAPTLVAMDMQHLYVTDKSGVRNLSLREGLRLFGYPDDFKFDIAKDLGYDLLGNTVVVPVIKAVANRLLDVCDFTKGGKR